MGEWISVKDRLPDSEDYYLTFDGYNMELQFFDFFRRNKFISFDENGYESVINRITHWMPLPEPPEK